MFERETVFVVGAGASRELGLPSGDELKDEVAKILALDRNGPHGFADAAISRIIEKRFGASVYLEPQRVDALRSAAARIQRGLPIAASIDNFLHSHQADAEVVELGKVAIAIAILRAERRSAFFGGSQGPRLRLQDQGSPDASIDREGIAASWYRPLAHLLLAGVRRGEAAEAFRRVTFVVFNYDRCLEQFVLMALQGYFEMTEAEAAAAIGEATFLHPYGSLGPLPWQTATGTGGLALGATDGVDFSAIAASIRTFTESVGSDLGNTVRSAVGGARTLVFMGFGFLRQNVELLRPFANRYADLVLSTAYGVSPDDQESIRVIVAGLARESDARVRVDAGTCRQMLDAHRITLSMG